MNEEKETKFEALRKKWKAESRKTKQRTNDPGVWIRNAAGKETFWSVNTIKERLKTDDIALKRALERIHSFQTRDEQDHAQTAYSNGEGFNGVDANILTSFHDQLEQKGYLSKKQMELLRKKMVKYARQLFKYSIDNMLKDLGKPIRNGGIGEDNLFEIISYRDYRKKLEEIGQCHLVEWERLKPYLTEEQKEDNETDMVLSGF